MMMHLLRSLLNRQLAGNRLDELKWGELEELELLHLNGLKAITEAKVLRTQSWD